jgi:hypothetical protein
MKAGVAFVVLLAVLACASRQGPAAIDGLQPLDPLDSLATDSAVLARIRLNHPCPSPVPPAWIAADTSLAAGNRCALVAAAVDAVRNRRAAPSVATLLERIDLRSLQCVHLTSEAYRNRVTGRLELTRWTVTLHLPAPPSLTVEIDRLSGEPTVYQELAEFGFDAATLCRRRT